MPRRFFIIIGMVILLGFSKTEAQNIVFDTVGNALITADTVVKEQKIEKSAKAKKPHSPKKATIMSACLPGLGQVYNRKWWKVPIVYAGLGGLGYMAYNNYYEYKLYLHAYEFKKDTLQKHDVKERCPKEYEQRLKSVIQQYMSRMNHNQLVFKK